MSKSQLSRLNVSRGLRGAMLCGLIGAAAPAALYLVTIIWRWLVLGADEYDRQADLRGFMTVMLLPIVGCATVFACAGWATFAPAGKFRFARSLAIVFSVSLLLWFDLGMLNELLEFIPRPLKGQEHPAPYLASILFFGTPVLVAAVLTAIRTGDANRFRKPQPPRGADDLL